MVTKEEINGYFLEAVRRLKAQGYTQKNIVETAGLPQNAISKIKSGQNNAGDDTINKLCKAYKLNPDFFYHGSTQFTIEEKVQQKQLSILPDMSSVFNSALAAKDDAIESLKRELRTKDDLIQSLRDQLAAKDQLIAEQKTRLIDYRRIIDSNENEITNYHFPVGAADDRKRKSKNL